MNNENIWDKRYSDDEYAYGTEPNDFLRETMHLIPEKGRVLCLADGEGRNSVFLAQHGFKVTAVDSSAVGLKKAKKLAAEKKVVITTALADLAEFQFEKGGFDCVVSIFCHLVPEIRKRVHHHIPYCLRPGGVIIIEGYTPRQLQYTTGGPPREDLMLTSKILLKELSQLEILQCQELEREIIEGSLHSGRGAVVQCIARK